MRFSSSGLTYEQQAGLNDWVIINETTCRPVCRASAHRLILVLKGGQLAMVIPLRNARCGQQGLVPRPQLAIAARDPAVSRCAGAGGKRLPSRTLTKRA